MMRVGLIGAGRIGQIRARVLNAVPDSRLIMVADTDLERARSVAAEADPTTEWERVVANPGIDAVIVATPTKFHSVIASTALEGGKHVLCEKPLGRNSQDAANMLEAARRHRCVLKTGFNYRYMPHVVKAKQLISAGDIGTPYFLRCRFGHGGRPGYEKEWCTDKELSGGGVLLEQGIHVLDLVRHLLGEPAQVLGQAQRYFWDLKDGVEDNFFCFLKTLDGQMADIHVSWTQWINTLAIEIYGKDGYLSLEGRDGHYGPPRLTWGRRKADHSRPCEERWEYTAGECWEDEWRDFQHAISSGAPTMASGLDGLRAQQVIDAAYASSRKLQWVEVADSLSLRPNTAKAPPEAQQNVSSLLSGK